MCKVSCATNQGEGDGFALTQRIENAREGTNKKIEKMSTFNYVNNLIKN